MTSPSIEKVTVKRQTTDASFGGGPPWEWLQKNTFLQPRISFFDSKKSAFASFLEINTTELLRSGHSGMFTLKTWNSVLKSIPYLKSSIFGCYIRELQIVFHSKSLLNCMLGGEVEAPEQFNQKLQKLDCKFLGITMFEVRHQWG